MSDFCEVNCIHDDLVRKLRKEQLTDTEANMLAETFKAMADPTRVNIINILAKKEVCVCDIAAILDMTQSAISHQLRLLRNLRLVKYRKEGKIVYYSLDDEHIINLFHEGLEHIRHQDKNEGEEKCQA